jgi:hypothetical protein
MLDHHVTNNLHRTNSEQGHRLLAPLLRPNHSLKLPGLGEELRPTSVLTSYGVADVPIATYLLVSLDRLAKILSRLENQREVCPLSRGVM